MVVEEYKKARKLAQKEFKKAVSQGISPYPEVLDEVLEGKETAGEQSLGTVEIPLELTVGTKGLGRQNAFCRNFLPLFDENSEFAGKWMSLYASQMEEGFRDAVIAYEYKNRYYIQEGNKRVSIMKYLKVPTITAKVKRIIPKKEDTKESRVYYEYMDFYELTKLNMILFTEPGGYEKLLKAVGKDWETPWSEDEIRRLKTVFYHFSVMYSSISGSQMPEVFGNAFLRCLEIFPYEEMKEKSSAEIEKELKSMKKEIEPEALNAEVEHVMEPEESKSSLVTKILPAAEKGRQPRVARILPSARKKVRVAFVYDEPVKDSGWIYAHELGRLHIEEMYAEELEVTFYENVRQDNRTEDAIEQAVSEGNTIIFTTSPTQMQASIKAALKHPEVYFFNCSLNFPYKSVRTYYTRMYEVKFLIGLIAGVMSEGNVIGYEADYPIFGTAANINAFALGVQMVRPDTKVRLFWSCVKEDDKQTPEKNMTVISAKEMITPKGNEKPYGLYQQYGDGITRLATSVLDWGKFYSRMIGFILDGTWKKMPVKDNRTLNYWWGLSAEVMDLICSDKIPYGTRKLVEKFRQFIAWGVYHPFEGIIYDQKGQPHGQKGRVLDTESIIRMNWLCENVIGTFPEKKALTPKALEMVELQGLEEENGENA
ncbi:MAG: BMP family ABC transporter substrate-binding protein [Eubacterium sp.]|nr:BMP family ABC transporter substrate-binding protein [Eubacterium sp.]